MARQFNTVGVPEYGREYWEKHQKDRRLTQEQLVEIALGHREREEQAAHHANRFLFIDTDATTTAHFSRHYHNAVHLDLQALANQTAARYDLVFLCADDIPYDDTWDRSGDTDRALFQNWIRADLIERGVPFTTLEGPLQERLGKATEILTSYKKW